MAWICAGQNCDRGTNARADPWPQKKSSARLNILAERESVCAITMAATLPNELNTLRELVSSLQTTLAAVQAENQLLRQKLDALARRIFGISSEALNPAQLQLLLTLPELAPAPTPAPIAPLTESAPRKVTVRKDRAPRLPDNAAGHRRSHRSRAGESATRKMALHRTGNQRTTR